VEIIEEDLTGKPVSLEHIDEALKVIQRHMVISILNLPPDLAVHLPNIHRCLVELRSMKK
jgi:hypothetical protein